MLSATFKDRLLSHTSASTRATPPILAPDRPQRCGFRVQSVSSSPGRVVKATPIRAAGIPDRVVAHACGNGSNPSVTFVETTNETQFVAETLLPTRTGNYRLRGYRHTVRPSGRVCMRPGRLVGLWRASAIELLRLRRWTTGCRIRSLQWSCPVELRIKKM